jgi:hypothetical protein
MKVSGEEHYYAGEQAKSDALEDKLDEAYDEGHYDGYKKGFNDALYLVILELESHMILISKRKTINKIRRLAKK